MPQRNEALIFADSHITSGRLEYDSYYGFEQVCQMAVDLKCTWLIGLGDLFDKRINSPAPIAFAKRMLDWVAKNGVNFGYIQGQHEGDDTPWMSLGTNAKHLHKQTIRFSGKLLAYGLDFLPRGQLQEELDNVPPEANILFTHQSWADWMGDITLPQGEFADITADPLKHLISGDFHETVCDEEANGKDGGEFFAWSPGSTYLTAVNHPKDKFCFLLKSGGGIVSKPLKSRIYAEWNIDTEEALECHLKELEDNLGKMEAHAKELDLPEAISRPMIRIVHSHKVSDIVRRLGRIIDDRAILRWKEKPRPKEQSELAAKARRMQEGGTKAITLRKALPECVDATKQKKVFELAQRMLDAGDTKEEIEQAARAWLKEQTDESS